MTDNRKRISCSGPGCKRTVEVVPEHTHALCQKCWARAPKHLRTRHTALKRRATIAMRNHHPDAARLEQIRNRVFWRIFNAIIAPSDEDGALPSLMKEELRSAGLL